MNNLQTLHNSVFNQLKYFSGNIQYFSKNIQNNMIQQNPMNSMQYNWQIAQMRKDFVFWSTLPFVISECFWTTWQQVYDPQ